MSFTDWLGATLPWLRTVLNEKLVVRSGWAPAWLFVVDTTNPCGPNGADDELIVVGSLADASAAPPPLTATALVTLAGALEETSTGMLMLIDCPVVSAVVSGSVHVTVCPELVHEIAFDWEDSMPVAPAESSVRPVGSVSRP